MNTSATNLFQEIHQDHIELRKQKDSKKLLPKDLANPSKELLEKIRLAGKIITDLSQRQRLESYALYWSRFISEVTDADEYPDFSLLEPEESLLQSEEVEEKPTKHQDWGSAPAPYPFYGRQQDLANLKEWIINDQCRLVGIFGTGGIGKSLLASKAAKDNENEFDYVIWRSLRESPPLDEILIDCIQFLSNQQETALKDSLNKKISQLLFYLNKYRCLIVLDNVESILRQDEAGHFREGFEVYGELIKKIGECQHQSCLLLTGREMPQEFGDLVGTAGPVRLLALDGLDVNASRQLLEDKGLSFLQEDCSCSDLTNFYAGNPLALILISEIIREIYTGDIAKFLCERGEREGHLLIPRIEDLINGQFERLSLLERALVRWLAIEREPVTANELRENIVDYELDQYFDEALLWLRRRSLVEMSASGFTLQNFVMECITEQFIKQIYDEIKQEKLKLFPRYVLLKAQSKEYIRENQKHIIIKPLVERIINFFTQEEIEDKFKNILTYLQKNKFRFLDYTAGNILNILLYLKKNLGWNINLSDYDFSYLNVRQADLHEAALHDVNFASANLYQSTFTETFGRIFSVAYDPEGKYLAAGSATGEIRLWQTDNGQLIRTFEGHKDVVWSLAFDSKGKTLASGNLDHTIRLWNVNSGKCRKVLQGHTNQVRSVSFSHDGQLLASGSLDFTLRLWKVDEGNCLNVLNEHEAGIITVAFNHDSSLVASGSEDKTIKIWDVKTGECLKTLEGQTRIRSVAFSPDSKLLASGGDDNNIYLWDVSEEGNFNLLKRLEGHRGSLCSVIFFNYNDSLWLASGGSHGTIRLWDISTYECKKTMQGHTDIIRSIHFNSKMKTLASGSDDQTVRWWDISTGKCLKTMQGYTNLIYATAFNRDGNTLVSGGETPGIQLWDVKTGKCRKLWQKEAKRIRYLALSPDDNILAVGSENNIIELWDMKEGKWLKTLRGHNHEVWSVVFINNNQLVSGSSDRTIRLWDINEGKCIQTVEGHTNRIRSLALSPDGNFLASGGFDKNIRIWNVKTGELCFCRELCGHKDVVWSLVFNDNGNILVSASEDKTIRLWDMETYQMSKTLEVHTEGVFSIALSATGLLASGSIDGTVKLWDVETGECRQTLSEHKRPVRSVIFSHDSRLLASGSDDETIKLWNPDTGECLNTLIPERPYERMNITGVKGLTEEQKIMLKSLGAVES